jgi:hypothetical protein
MLQKSPSRLREIEICNYRIGAPVLLNRCCVLQPDLESIFLASFDVAAASLRGVAVGASFPCLTISCEPSLLPGRAALTLRVAERRCRRK